MTLTQNSKESAERCTLKGFYPGTGKRTELCKLINCESASKELPQAEKLPDHWVKMIANGDRAKAAGLQDEWVHRLGNLTLSGYNSDLATAPFEKKQKLTKDRNFLGHRINIGYKNGLALNSMKFKTQSGSHSLADAPAWNREMIHSRTQLMVETIAKTNLLPSDK